MHSMSDNWNATRTVVYIFLVNGYELMRVRVFMDVCAECLGSGADSSFAENKG
jgi:hypothetical protein